MNNKFNDENIKEMLDYVNKYINTDIYGDCANIDCKNLLSQDDINNIIDEVYNNNKIEDLDTAVAGL